MKYFLPIIFLQIYLILTLIVFQFGPIRYNIENPGIFWGLILIYHLCFLLGYIIAYKLKKRLNTKYKFKLENAPLKLFYYILILSVVSSIISFKGQASLLELINPLYWIQSAFKGVLFPGDSYNDKMIRVLTDQSGNKILNIGLFLISFSKILIVPFTVYFWKKLSIKIKFVAIFVTLLPLLSSLSHGTNKGVFDFAILYSSSLVFLFIYNKYKHGAFMFKTRKFFIYIIIVSIIGAFSFFGTSMSSRGGNIRYIESMDPLNNISVYNETISKSKESSIYYTYAWLSSYIVQGYYGFSLNFKKDFETTFGFGNSEFIRRNVEGLLGVDLRKKTYQYKINSWWGEYSQWHSFYSYFANDFGYIGVGIVCFIISFLMGNVWFNFIDTGNIFAGAFMSIFTILIIFIPANNQIFGFLDGLSAFTWTYILWYISNHKFKKIIKI